MAEEQNTSGCSEESCASCASAGTCKSKKVDMHEPMNMYSSIKKSDRRCQWKGWRW